MSTFKEAYEDVLDVFQRLPTEQGMAVRAKKYVNDAIRWANLSHPFVYSREFANVTYPSNAQSIDLVHFAGNVSLGIITAEQLARPQDFFGRPMKVMTYESLFNRRLDAWKGMQFNDEYNKWEELVKDNSFCVINGSTLSVYPTPQTDITLKVSYIKSLPLLVDDNDTNFILDYCYDFVQAYANYKFALYLKEDERVKMFVETTTEKWEMCKRWNDTIQHSTSSSLNT